MNTIIKRLRTNAAALIMPVLLAFVVAGVTTGICDAVVAGLVLAGLTSFGEAIAYTMLAQQSDTGAHGRAYWFIAGANWTTTFLLAVLLLATFGIWQPFPAVVSTDHGLAPRQMERIELIGRIASGKRASAAGSGEPAHLKDIGGLRTPQPAEGDGDQTLNEPSLTAPKGPSG